MLFPSNSIIYRFIIKFDSLQFKTIHDIMLKLIVLLALFGAVIAQNRPRPSPRSSDADIQTVRQESQDDGAGNWNSIYELSDGTKVEVTGYVKPAPPGAEEPIHAQRGYFIYRAPEGDEIKTNYEADERGFVPAGAHLPTSPPIPAEIQRSLAIQFKNAGDQRQARSSQRF